MKALFVVPNNYEKIGGVYLPVKNYIKQLEAKHVDCTVFLLPYRQKDADQLFNSFSDIIKNDYDSILVYGLNQAFIVKKWFRRLNYNGRKIALLVDSLVLEMSSVIKTTRIGKKRLIFRLKRILYYFKERECLKYYDSAVFVSLVDKEYVEKKYKKVIHDVYYIPNGSALPEANCNRSYNGCLKIGCLTGFSKETVNNNLLPLLDNFFPEINKHYPNTELIIAGRGCPRDFEGYINSKRGVRFLGFVDNLEDFYNSVDIIVTTVKKRSGILNRVLEAWAYSKPVVGFNHNFATFQEAIDGTHYLSADSPADFVMAIGGLINNPARIVEIGKRGNQLVSCYYSWEKSGDKLYSIIND